MKTSDLRVQRTRKAIDDAFWELMKKKDFGEITVHDVSTIACINRVTFYHHYEDKYDWLQQTIEKLFAQYDFVMEEIFSQNGEADILAGFHKSIAFFEKHEVLFTVLLDNEGTNFFQKRYKDILIEMMKKDPRYRRKDKAESAFWMHYSASALVGAFDWWIRNHKPISPECFAENLYHAYLHNLSE